MGMSAWKRAGVCLTAAAVVAGVAGCGGGDEGGSEKKAADSSQSEVQTQNQMTKVLQAAFKNTSEAKSSKVRMTMEMPAGLEGGGTMELPILCYNEPKLFPGRAELNKVSLRFDPEVLDIRLEPYEFTDEAHARNWGRPRLWRILFAVKSGAAWRCAYEYHP